MPVDSMQKYLDRRYDSHVAWCMYNEGFPVEDIMLFVAPLIQILSNTRFRRVTPDQLEDSKAQAFCDLMENLITQKERRRHYALEKQFHYDCWWTAFRAFNRALRFNKQEELNLDDLEHPRLPHPRDLDRTNWMNHMVEDVRAAVLEQVRFSDSEFGACEYVLRALLDKRRATPMVIQRDYKLTHADFYIDYVKVLIRKSLWDFLDDPYTYETLLEDVAPMMMDTAFIDTTEHDWYHNPGWDL